jgi:Family of unknown function (DUF6893)
MTRHSKRAIKRAATTAKNLLELVVATQVALLAVRSIPDAIRYLRMRMM